MNNKKDVYDICLEHRSKILNRIFYKTRKEAEKFRDKGGLIYYKAHKGYYVINHKVNNNNLKEVKRYQKFITIYLDFIGLIGLALSPLFALVWLLSLLNFNNSDNYWILFIFVPLEVLAYRSLFTMFDLKERYN